MDETLALPSEMAVTIALRTQQILAEESGVAATADPLGGSYFVEDLTHRMERAALDYIRRIDEMGGIVAAIEAGFPQREIAEASYHYQLQVDRGEKTIVGVNRHRAAGEDEHAIPILKIDLAVERDQLARLAALKARRGAGRHEAALRRLEAAASTDENLMPRILECVKAYATVGEICGTLKTVFGEYREQPVL
jgi:methylmalonyl-CoA mutase N-terminal domain/subunit